MVDSPTPKKIVIIAGPNGAGKTTFAWSFLPAEIKISRFINAGLIAAGLAPFAPQSADFRAGRLMLEEINRVAERVSQGGHNLPESVIRRHFLAGIRNFYQYYQSIVNDWTVYDNSGLKPILLEWGDNS